MFFSSSKKGEFVEMVEGGIMEAKKKSWETPQLIILARGTPEESVLASCKAISTLNPGPNTSIQNSCSTLETTNCSNCASRGGGAS